MRDQLETPLRDVTDRGGALSGPADAAMAKFAIGQPVHRREDPILVRGEGRYTDDVQVEGQAYAAFVRSPYAHGIIKSVDLDAARDLPGVIGVFGAADLNGYGPFPNVTAFKNRDGSPMQKTVRKPLAQDRVRYVGDPVAFVVAETLVEAREAAEAVQIEIDELPAAATAREAIAEGAAQLYDEIAGNLFLDFQFGDPEKVDAAIAGAAHVTRLDIASHRLIINPMEPRTAIGEWDAAAGLL